MVYLTQFPQTFCPPILWWITWSYLVLSSLFLLGPINTLCMSCLSVWVPNLPSQQSLPPFKHQIYLEIWRSEVAKHHWWCWCSLPMWKRPAVSERGSSPCPQRVLMHTPQHPLSAHKVVLVHANTLTISLPTFQPRSPILPTFLYITFKRTQGQKWR